ncbi:hypothetical protein CEXT_724901 [Caerostris extrusa]|uniref:Uncharacterized protein n=1 Tax=Caerostris extrusa TaxID=172846 RepID=A0AAV4XRF2_CAEEX|nr:hypothetical protein CEXT_724901 [Caerostris extrusa]
MGFNDNAALTHTNESARCALTAVHDSLRRRPAFRANWTANHKGETSLARVVRGTPPPVRPHSPPIAALLSSTEGRGLRAHDPSRPRTILIRNMTSRRANAKPHFASSGRTDSSSCKSTVNHPMRGQSERSAENLVDIPGGCESPVERVILLRSDSVLHPRFKLFTTGTATCLLLR